MSGDYSLLVAGSITNAGGIRSNGAVVTSADGALASSADPGITDVAQVTGVLGQTGKFVAYGNLTTPNYRLARFLDTGAADSSFTPAVPDGAINAMLADGTGYFIIGPFNNVGATGREGFARLNADGTLDAGWAGPTGIGGSSVRAVVAHAGGVVIASGSTLYRITAAGVDAGFTPATFNGTIYTLRVVAGNKILVGGSFTTVDGASVAKVARLNSDGTRDTGWVGPTATGDWTVMPPKRIYDAGGGKWYVDINDGAKGYVKRINADGSSDAWGGETREFAVPVGVDESTYTVVGWDSQTGGNRLLYKYDAAGSLVSGFGVVAAKSTGNTGYIGAMVPLAAGKTLAAGTFTTYAGARVGRVVRINADGTIDDTFTDPGLAGVGAVRAIGTLADGKLVFAGGFVAAGTVAATNAALLPATGAYSPYFYAAVKLVTVVSTPKVSAVALLPDGRAYVAGYFDAAGNAVRTSLAKLLPDGTADPNYADPKVQTGTTPGFVNAMLVQPDGDVLVVGDFNKIATAYTRSNVARFHADGTPDGPFNTPTLNGAAYCVARQADGKVLVGGAFTTVGGVAQSGLVRFNTDGTRDTGFANPLINITFSKPVNTVIVQPDGKIIVGGLYDNINGSPADGCVRLNADGTADGSFNSFLTGRINCAALQADGKILAGGTGGLYRMLADGTADGAWANPFGGSDKVYSVLIDPDGNVVVTGKFNLSGRVGVVRLTPSGAVDTSFPANLVLNGAGDAEPTAATVVATPALAIFPSPAPPPAFVGRAASLSYQVFNGTPPYTESISAPPAGMALSPRTVSGTPTDPGVFYWSYTARDSAGAVASVISRLHVHPVVAPNGLLLFGPSGVTRVNQDGSSPTLVTATNAAVTVAKRMPDGKIVIGGVFSTVGGSTRYRIARLNADGTLDTGFAGPASGVVVGTPTAIGQQSTGKLIVCSYSDSVPHNGYAVRLGTSGALDATFTLDATAAVTGLSSVLVLADDRLIFGGCSLNNGNRNNRREAVAFRTSADGVLDSAYVTAFSFATAADAFSSSDKMWSWAAGDYLEGVASLTLLADGKVLAAGSLARRHGSFSAPQIVLTDRLLPDGGYDLTWYGNLSAVSPISIGAQIQAAFVNPDGTTTVMGRFNSGNAIASTLLSGFAILDKFGNVSAVAPAGQEAGGVYITDAIRLPDGRFVTAGHVSYGGIKARLFPDGAEDASFTPPGTTTYALLSDDNGTEGFASDGTVSITAESQSETPIVFAADSSIYFFGPQPTSVSVQDQIGVADANDATIIVVMRALLALAEARTPTYTGTASLADTIGLDDPLFYVLQVTLEEGLAISDTLAGSYTALTRVIERLLVSGQATGYIDALVQVLDALVLNGLAEAMAKGELAETVALNDTIAALYAAMAQVLEQIGLSDTLAGTSTAFVVVREELALSADLTHAADLAVLVRESVGFAATLAIDNGEYIAWVMNTEGDKPVSRYTQYPFNSFAKIGGRYVGADATGLHWLEGADDNGEAVHARLRAGLSAMGTRRLKRLPEAFIAYRSDGTLLLRLIQVNETTGEKEAGVFVMRPRPAGTTRENRITLGKGWKAVDFDFELENVDGADFDLTALEFRPLYLDRRTRG